MYLPQHRVWPKSTIKSPNIYGYRLPSGRQIRIAGDTFRPDTGLTSIINERERGGGFDSGWSKGKGEGKSDKSLANNVNYNVSKVAASRRAPLPLRTMNQARINDGQRPQSAWRGAGTRVDSGNEYLSTLRLMDATFRIS